MRPETSVRRVPVPWRADHLARNAVQGLRSGCGARLETVLAAGVPALNRIAADRLLGRVAEACSSRMKTARFRGARHQSLAGAGLVAARAAAAGADPAEKPGMSCCRLFVIAGKRLDWRSLVPCLDVAPHALARAVERGGVSEAVALQALVQDAGHAAETILLAFAMHGATRWGAGSVQVLVPAGFGAFLGYMRLLRISGSAAGLLPVIEAHTWIHRGMFSTFQAEAEDRVLAAVARDDALPDLVDAICRLPAPRSVDRRLASGISVVAPGDDAPAHLRSELACVASVATTRLTRGMADPDGIAWERRLVGRAA